MTELHGCKSQPGAILRAGREGAGLSRQALATEVGVSISTIDRVELEDHLPRFSVLAAMCRRLGLSLDDLAAALLGVDSTEAVA